MARQVFDFSLKKHPRQQRSRATFEALVEACARLLSARGYAGVTTNHIAEAAGVGIASLYEYFPGKDAVIAQVAERLVERVMARLGQGMDEALAASPREAVSIWIHRIYDTLRRERALVSVFVYEVPYTNRLPAVRDVTTLLMNFSEQARQRAGIEFDRPRAELYLLINLVSSTVLQMILEPPGDISADDLKTELVIKVTQWLQV